MASRRPWVRIPSAPPKRSSEGSPLPFHVYILESETTGRFYVGQTKDLEERVAYHNAGYSKYLKNRGPWKLVHSESYGTRSEAVRRERSLKQQKSRSVIERLLSAFRSP